MSASAISAVAGIIISLALEYIPGLDAWYAKFTPQQKRLVMLGALVLVVAGAFALSCTNLLGLFACTVAGGWEAVMALIAALVANQSVHLVLKKG